MLAAIGIVKGQPFNPDAHSRAILDAAAKTGFKMGRVLMYSDLDSRPGALIWPDRHYLDPNRSGTMDITWMDKSGTFRDLDARTGIYSIVYASSPAMMSAIPGQGARYVTAYDSLTASGLDNGQPFPSLNKMDKPAANPDGSTDIYLGAKSPGQGKNWVATVPGKGFFVILRLYGPTEAYFGKSWKPDDITQVK